MITDGLSHVAQVERQRERRFRLALRLRLSDLPKRLRDFPIEIPPADLRPGLGNQLLGLDNIDSRWICET
jgi:hypothetical protein